MTTEKGMRTGIHNRLSKWQYGLQRNHLAVSAIRHGCESGKKQDWQVLTLDEKN